MDLNQLKSIQNRLSQINQSYVENLLMEEILANGGEIVALVKERWKKGLRPDGSIIGRYRSFPYEMEKRQRNPQAQGNVDLVDTGALRDGLTVNYLRAGIFSIFSTDEKAVRIAQKYGLSVFGLTNEEEKDVLIEASDRIYERLFNEILV